MNLRLTPSSADDVTPPAPKAKAGGGNGGAGAPAGDRRKPHAPPPQEPPDRVVVVNSQTTTATVPAYALPPSDSGIGLSLIQRPPPTPSDMQKTVIVDVNDGLMPPASSSLAPTLPAPAPPPPAPPAVVQAPPATVPVPAPAVQASPAAVQATPPAPTPAAAGEAAPRVRKLRPRRRRRSRLKHLLPAWSVSLVVHLVIFSALAAATFTSTDAEKKPINFDTALAGHRNDEPEPLPIYADPKNIPRDQAVGDEHAADAAAPMEALDDGGGSDGGGAIVAGGFTKSTTPRVRGRGKRGVQASAVAKLEGMEKSSLKLLPSLPAVDLFGGGQFAGDPAGDVKEVGEALDQIAREILRHLVDHKVTVVWLFDESASMQDDQRAILDKFNRVSLELNKNVSADKKAAGALTHSVVGFGEGIKFMTKKPTAVADDVKAAVKKLPIDTSGAENTMHAIREAVEAHAGLITKDRKVLLILVTDESGDDGVDVEEARQSLKKHNVPLYVIGRQSMFGYPFAHHEYTDPVTKDRYHPLIHRGPETADVEIYQWDGLYDRWDEQPSGFAPWELARLTRDSGGIYFLLPSEEFMRVRQREQAYSIAQLREYLPAYENRVAYVQKRTQSDLRRTLYKVITDTREFRYRRDFPVEPGQLVQAAMEEIPKATERLAYLGTVLETLESLTKHREREPEKRWQAHFDLMLAQTVAFQVKAYEYRALMAGLAQAPQAPTKQPTAEMVITFVVDHSGKPLAPHSETAKKYAEAKRLLDDVIAKHPNTPWADLAKDTLARGFSVVLNQWEHNPKYAERAQFVPKY